MAQKPRPLPPRYEKVADLLAKNRSPVEIAEHLGIRETTAAYYVHRVQAYRSQLRAAEAGLPPKLTPREGEVAGLLERGATDREIADQLGIGHRTVETHVGWILRKLGLATRAAIVRHRAPDTGIGALTWRELKVLHLIARGLSHSQVARRLNIDERTVDSHAFAIRKKLRVPGYTSLARFGMEPPAD